MYYVSLQKSERVYREEAVNSQACWFRRSKVLHIFCQTSREGECADYMRVIGTVALGLASGE